MKLFVTLFFITVSFFAAVSPVYAGPTGSISASTSSCSLPCSGVTITWTSQLGGGNVHVEQNGATISNAASASNFAVTISAGTNTFNLFVAGSNDDENGNTMRVTVTGSNATPTPNPVQISNINVSTGQNSATISWSTNIPTSGSIDYGQSAPAYGSNVNNNSSAKSTSHSLNLNNLSTGTTYHYDIKSTDANGNTSTSGDKSFTTNAQSSGSGNNNSQSSPTATPTPKPATPTPVITSPLISPTSTPSPTPGETLGEATVEGPTPTIVEDVLSAKTNTAEKEESGGGFLNFILSPIFIVSSTVTLFIGSGMIAYFALL